MKEQTKIIIDTTEGKILDLDADEFGNFIAITDTNAIITPDHLLQLEVLKLRFPKLRRLNKDLFFIADSRTSEGQNGHICTFDGQIERSFSAGDGIEDILIHHNKIIITYFDEGVYGDDGPNQDGLAVFSIDGKYEFGVNSSKGFTIVDCYAICKHSVNSVLFYAYGELAVYELNLNTNAIEVFETPTDFAGASAISILLDKVYLHSSYKEKRSFFEWDRNKQTVRKFGDYHPELKGLPNGKFLSFGEKGYTIIDVGNT